MTHTCPECGSVHDTEGGLVSHLSKSQDDAHSDYEDRGDAWVLVRNTSTWAENGTSESGDGDDVETSESDGGNNPTIDGGPPEVDDPECPECGGNRYFDASEHTEYQYGCPDCSDEENWVVWG